MLKYFEILWIVLVLAATVMIFSFSAKDAENSSAQSKVISNTVVDIIEKTTNKTIGELGGKSDAVMRKKVHGFIRKSAHFLEYMLLGAIAFVAVFLSRHGKKYFTTLAIGVCAAVVDECMQFFSVGRATEWKDIFTDIAGVALGIILGILILKIIRNLYVSKA